MQEKYCLNIGELCPIQNNLKSIKKSLCTKIVFFDKASEWSLKKCFHSKYVKIFPNTVSYL